MQMRILAGILTLLVVIGQGGCSRDEPSPKDSTIAGTALAVGAPQPAQELISTAPAYRESQVTEAARRILWPAPHYPDSLKAAGTQGEVLLQFVVDTLGRVEPTSVLIVRSTHPAFNQAILVTAAGARFTAAIRNGIRVRQIAQQSFVFSSRRPGR